MRSSSTSPTRRRSLVGALASATLLLASLLPGTVGSAAAAPIPPAPPLHGSTAEQVGGSAQGLGQNVGGQRDGSGLGPSVYTGEGSGPDRYVALGDSYAAVGRISPGAWSQGPVGCVRTDDAYPAVVARALGAGTFVNASCGGAVTDDFWEAEDGVPPQLDALDAGTDVVSLTIGGNDVGFGAVILGCAVRPLARDAGALPVADLAATEISEGIDASAGCADVIDRQSAEALDQLDSRLDEVYGEIAERSPDARVVTAGYLSAIPDDETIRNSPDCELLMAAGEADRDRMRAFQGEINRVVRDAAERNGATVVIPDEPGHSMCAPAAERWVDLTGLQTGAAPVHPTAAGHAHVGERVLEALEAR